MSRQVVRDQQDGFGGGLNRTADESQLAANEVRRAENFVLTEFGAVVKRGGTRQLNASALNASNAVQNGFGWRKDDGTVQELVLCGGKLLTATYGTPPVTFTDQGAFVASTGAPAFAAFRDSGGEVVYVADGGPLNSWDGATATTNIASTPNATQLAVYNQRLFGITGDSQTLYWSTINNGDSLGVTASGGGSAIVRTFGDQVLTALATVRGSLLLFHVSGISRFTGLTLDDINIAAGTEGVTSDVGTIAPRTVVSLETEVLFLTERGFYSASDEGVQPVSTKIDVDVAALSATALAASFAVHFRARREVWFYVSGVGFYVFNYRLRQWTGPQASGLIDPATTCGWESQDASSVPIVLLGDADGYVKRLFHPATYRDDVASDGTGGASYEAVLELRRLFCGDFTTTKAWRWGWLLMDLRNTDDVTVEWSTDYGAGSYSLPLAGSAWGSGTWGMGTWGGAGVASYRIPMGGRSRFADITIRDNGDAGALYSRFEIEGLDLGKRA